MKQLITLFFIIAGLPALAQSQNSSTKDDAVKRKLESNFTEMTSTFLRDDMLGVSGMYTDDAVIVTGRQTVQGRAALDKYWLGLKGKGKDWKLKTISLEVYDTFAFHDGTSDLTYLYQGKEHNSHGRFLVVWKKQTDGSWKILKDYFTPF